MKRRIFYDTETTGIRHDKDAIIEIAAYDADRKLEFVRLVNPGMPIPEDATAIHGITNEMVADVPDFSVVGKEFLDFCGEDAVLIAHNNERFDKIFLQNEGLKHEVIWPTSWIYFDTLIWARRYRPDLPKHSLQFLREVYGFEANNAHRALDDVLILHKVFMAMCDDLNIEQILELMSASKTIQNMPFGKYRGKPLKQIPKDYIEWLVQSGAFEKPENEELKKAFTSVGLI